MSPVLILSDGRMGHLNQSIAFAKYLNRPYDIAEVHFKNKLAQTLSYFFDKLGIKTALLFDVEIIKKYDVTVATGSTTYYAAKVLAKGMKAKSVAMMLPKGYRFDFDVIFAQSHDNPPKQDNIVEIPANFSYVEPRGLYRGKKPSIGIVIGGDNKLFTMTGETIQKQLNFIKEYYREYEIAVSTSPRTSKEIEKLIEEYNFDYEVIYSKNPINPLPDFLEQCETVFITGDSTSMISEAISYGKSNVVALPLESQEENKFTRFMDVLEKEGYLHVFDGTVENKNKKIDFKTYTKELYL
ncbi:ELM1/GtrOC1 family putative glycosyltransferase [Sulfurovum sp.]|uniref:ELM1/GtrOC1 family putative glycosyltransferase n=1 Tax=Sulfurovum sp. TaxID=1969726 RepID=UPI002867CB79|nr:ELM1/GtrOC1 family putative glycosyltransferase [Sulfurovum sp.]